jgi:hypothetical protein
MKKIFRKTLALIHPETSPMGQRVEVTLQRDEHALSASFHVWGGGSYVNPALSSSPRPWDLWKFDVVELFIGAVSEPGQIPESYFEFQVSPLDQGFELKILEPRKRYDEKFKSHYSHSARKISDDEWVGELRIPLGIFEQGGSWDGRPETLVGNAFSILGGPHKRAYWSLYLPKQQVPDFHLPQYFRPLLT